MKIDITKLCKIIINGKKYIPPILIRTGDLYRSGNIYKFHNIDAIDSVLFSFHSYRG